MKKISRTLTSLFTCAMTGAMLIPAFAVNADMKIEISKKNFPDKNFREILKDEACDDNQDGYLSSDEIKEIKFFNIEECGIKDLTGIELLTYVDELNVDGNEISTIDLSKNTKLEWLSVEKNNLDKLDVSKNPKLHTLRCGGNNLKTLDLSKNTELLELSVESNELDKLDLSKNTKLYSLCIDNNNIDKLDLSKNTELVFLDCVGNNLKTLDLSKHTKLWELTLTDNKIEKLDLSNSTELEKVYVADNNLKTLDLPKNNIIEVLSFSNNNISKPDLSSLKGLEFLDCANNGIKTLDIASCKYLLKLDCSYNSITSLDLKSCNSLYELHCNNNKLTTLDVSNLGDLSELYCQGNQIDKLDVSNNDWLPGATADKAQKDGYVVYTAGQWGGLKLAVDNKTRVIFNKIIDDNTKQIYLNQGEEKYYDFVGADDQTQVKLSSSDDSVVKIGKNNSLVTLKAGSSDITAKVGDKEYKFKVTVYYDDVKDNTKFWFEPTYALTEKGVVKGYDNQTKFKPANKCTRAQMVTFIWRLAGSPEPETKECKFSDVKKSDYFYKACLWGNENHIVEGYKNGTFGPQIVCARRHAVTFLWRLAGKPEPNVDKIKFTDVFKDINEDDYFYEACLWASEKKIVAGYSDNTFRPNGDCLRRQMVTFLYKFDKNVGVK